MAIEAILCFVFSGFVFGVAAATGAFSMLLGRKQDSGGCFFRVLTLVFTLIAILLGFGGLSYM